MEGTGAVDHSVQYVRNNIKVIVNRDMPWQSSTSYYGEEAGRQG